jgi:murein DD-endopeptidase MepM/ murein hydrolase activator NlpD
MNCRSLPGVLAIICLACLGCNAWGREEQAIPQDTNLEIVERREGDRVVLLARLKDCSEATITLSMKLENMAASQPLPLTVDAAGRPWFELVTLRPIDPDLYRHYSFRYDWEPGGRSDSKPRSTVYSLPYVGGKYKVIQGYLGALSHYRGSQNEYAIDFAMPVGTKVCAAFEGTVAAFRQDSDLGGADEKFAPCDNYMVVKHADGTFAEYRHLKKAGVLVKLGQNVQRHQPLAISGNSGYSTGPHLHFAVFYNIDGKTRKTIPTRFKTDAGVVEGLQQSSVY